MPISFPPAGPGMELEVVRDHELLGLCPGKAGGGL